MNITDYRAMKAQEATQKEQTSSTPVVQTTPPTTVSTPVVPETKTPEVKVEPVIPDKITIDGIGEVTLDELKNGYLRQSDYTKKTQAVAREKDEVKDAVKFVEQLKANPELAQQVTNLAKGAVPKTLDPSQAKISELENKIYDMMLDNEVTKLQSKYPDFEAREVLAMAEEYVNKNIAKVSHILLDDELTEEEIKSMERENGGII